MGVPESPPNDRLRRSAAAATVTAAVHVGTLLTLAAIRFVTLEPPAIETAIAQWREDAATLVVSPQPVAERTPEPVSSVLVDAVAAPSQVVADVARAIPLADATPSLAELAANDALPVSVETGPGEGGGRGDARRLAGSRGGTSGRLSSGEAGRPAVSSQSSAIVARLAYVASRMNGSSPPASLIAAQSNPPDFPRERPRRDSDASPSRRDPPDPFDRRRFGFASLPRSRDRDFSTVTGSSCSVSSGSVSADSDRRRLAPLRPALRRFVRSRGSAASFASDRSGAGTGSSDAASDPKSNAASIV